MLRIPIDEITEKIAKASGLSDKEIKKKIQEKMSSLDGLVSEEGAAHIIAHELGIELFKTNPEKEYKIKDLPIGLRQFKTKGVITRVFDIKTFNKKGSEGKVGSFTIEDETGYIRIVLWNETTKLIESGKVAEGKTIRVQDGMVKANNYMGKENGS